MRRRIALLLVASVAVLAATASTALAHPHFRAIYTYKPVHLTPQQQVNQSAASIPIFAGQIKSPTDGNTYQYSIVGKTPFRTQTAGTPPPACNGSHDCVDIGTDIVPIKVVIAGVTYSAAGTEPAACGEATGGTVLNNTANSPLFVNHQYTVGGVNVGDTQYEDAFQREEFGSYVFGSKAANPGYHVLLTPAKRAVVTVTIPAQDSTTYTSAGSTCPLAGIEVNYWENTVVPSLVSRLETAGATNTLRDLILLTSNVVFYDTSTSNCCILGFHSGTPGNNGAMQYYETADYDSTGYFTNGTAYSGDVSALSHELGEWINDPSGGNATPAWGHIGQVSGCQNNLEVGDPLSGTTVSVGPMPNGLTYHPQELAFFSWFYRTYPSGIDHWYSSNGTFKTNAGPLCS